MNLVKTDKHKRRDTRKRRDTACLINGTILLINAIVRYQRIHMEDIINESHKKGQSLSSATCYVRNFRLQSGHGDVDRSRDIPFCRISLGPDTRQNCTFWQLAVLMISQHELTPCCLSLVTGNCH